MLLPQGLLVGKLTCIFFPFMAESFLIPFHFELGRNLCNLSIWRAHIIHYGNREALPDWN